MTETPHITVFTPTFNRANTLHRVFESLQKQSFTNFEWLIVDDGSKDNTEQLVKTWQQIAAFPVRYFFQENGGKHIAHNTALELAHGLFFIVADSDDRFVPDALHIFNETWASIPESEKPNFAGIWALVANQKGTIVGNSFPTSPWDSYWVDKIYRANSRGEQWNMQRLDVLKQFPFPALFPGEGFYMSEAVVWKKINAQYKFRCINKALRIYYDTPEGIMSSKPRTERQIWLSDMSSKVLMEAYLNEDIQHFWLRPKWFCKWMIYYTKYAFATGSRLRDVLKNLKNNQVRLLFILFLPLYPIVWLYSTLRRAANKQI
jgi:glycosyltransferase involved in cell wall biosynthesis